MAGLRVFFLETTNVEQGAVLAMTALEKLFPPPLSVIGAAIIPMANCTERRNEPTEPAADPPVEASTPAEPTPTDEAAPAEPSLEEAV